MPPTRARPGARSRATPAGGGPHLGRATLRFLKDLERNNRKAWFDDHRAAYERDVRDASVGFVKALLPEVQALSPRYTGEAKPVGGSIMRIHRDVRFSKDKSPYRTSLGIHFWHEDATDDRRAPAWYVHVAPKEVFAGGGLYDLPPADAQKVREAVAAEPDRWAKAKAGLALDGEQLARVPKPWAADHPLAGDLRRKQFLWSVPLKASDVGPAFPARCAAAFRKGAPLMEMLTGALGFPY